MGSYDRERLLRLVLDRKYRVDRFVAEGGYGLVYAGHHLTLDTKVAIKVLRPEIAGDAAEWSELLTQFLDEARTLARLRHPSVVAVLDTGTTQIDDHGPAVPWMVLEWLEGRTLADDLAARRGRGGRPPAECLALLRPVLDAMAHAHAAGVAHRDLKPSNIMLAHRAEGATARVLDFGIAKLLERDGAGAAAPPTGLTATQSPRAAFTPSYAAPEQVSHARTGPWTDVFALGLIVTEMLVDAAPLENLDPTERVARLLAETRPTPAAFGVDVGAWEPVLARALAVRAADRQPDARALLEDLDSALEGTPSIGRAQAARSFVPPRARPRRALVVGALLLVAAVAAALVPLRKAGRAALAPASPPASVVPGLVATAVTDLTPPKEVRPEAAAAYVAGLQSLRDGRLMEAKLSFQRAVDREPGFAAACVQLAAVWPGDLEQTRRWVATAVQHRASLGERDAALLEGEREESAHWGDWEAGAVAFQGVMDRFPGDAEIVALAADRAGVAHHVDRELELLSRALRLDPKFGLAFYFETSVFFGRLDLDRVVQTADACLAAAPNATSCMRARVEASAERGECARLADDARAMIAIEPDVARGYQSLGEALASQWAPAEAVQQTLRRAADLEHDAKDKETLAALAEEIASWMDGDFGALSKRLPEYERRRATEASEARAFRLVRVELDVLEELGDTRHAVDLAQDYLRRLPVLTHDMPGAGRAEILGILRRAGRLSPDDVRAQRAAWEAEGAVRWGWLDLVAAGVRTPEEAREALASAPPLKVGFELDVEEILGRVHLLGGRLDEAVTHLRRASARCFYPEEVTLHLRATEELGEALEATGDRAGACAAYVEVLARWGKARPRSTTAEKARARAGRLGCGG